MRRFYCFTLGFFLLTVRAEKEDFQGHHTEQTKDTTVTKDQLLKKEITIGHGTEAISTESTQQHTAVSAKAERPEVDLFDNRPALSNERTQIPKASGVIASMSDLISRNEQNSLKSTGDNSSAMRIHTESGTPLISNYDKIVFSSTQAAFESMTNASEPEASPSADMANASFWLHTLLDNGNQRNTVSIALTSADRGPGVPALSASRPRVIDNPTALRNDSDDKRSRGADDKGISNLGRNEHPLGTVQSIFPSDSAKDSTSGSTATNLCLTCQKDRREVSAEKSVARPPPSPDGTSASLSVEGLALDLSEFTTSLHQQSVGERGEMLNKDTRQQNVTKHSPSGVREQLVNSMSFPPLSLNETVNHSNSQINYFLSDTETFNTLVELSSATQDTKEQSHHTFPSGALVTGRPIPTITALYRSELLYTGRKQEMLREKVSTEEPQSKLMYFSQHNKNASHSLSANFKNVFVQNQSLDASDSADVAEDPPPHGGDQSAASHPTARMGLIEARSSAASFSLSRATTSAVKDPESHSLTGRAESLISVSRSQTPAKAGSSTKRPILTSDIELTSVTTKRRLTDERESPTSNTVNSIVKQYIVDPSGPARKPVMKEAQTPTVTMRKVVPVTLLLSESRRDLEDDTSTSTRTPPSKLFSESPTMSRLLVSQSEINQAFELRDDNNVAPTLRSVVKYSRNINRDSLIDEDNIMKTEGQVVKETKEALKLQEEEESREDEKVESKREELFRSHTTERGKKIMNTGVEINHTTDHEEDRMEEHEATMRREEVGGTTRREDVTLREDKGRRQVEVREEEDAEEQRGSSTKEGAESKGDFAFNGEMRREDMTNVPLGTTTNSAELNKGHTTTNLSSCLGLIKQFGAPEQEGIRLGGNTAPIVEVKNKPFSYEVTSNHRPLHSTLRSQSPNQSRMTSLPEEPRTQIKPHPFTRGAALTKHTATKRSPQNQVVKATFFTKTGPKPSQAFGVSTPKFSNTFKPTISPHSGATKSAHPVLKSPSKTLSLTTPPLAIQVEFLGAQQHFAVNTLSVSIIYSTSDLRRTFSTLDSQEISLLQTTNKRQQAEHILPTSRFDASVKEPLTSDTSEEVNQSAGVKAAPTQQMDNDSSPRPPTAAALSSVAHTSTGRPHRRQSAPEISQSTSSSSDMSPGQPCSFKLSEHTAHSDALHVPVDDNEQRSVQTLMTSMSPKAKNDQFPLSGMSALPNLMLLEDDSLPGTYSLTGLTRSASEKEILRANADAEYANGGSGRAGSLLGAAEAGNQTEANDSAQKTATSGVKHSYGVAKHMSESKDERESSPFVEQTSGRSEQHASNTEAFNSLSPSHTERLAGDSNEDNRNALFNVEGSDDANNTVKTALESHLSQLRAHTETSTIQTTLEIEQAISEDVTNDFAVSVLDTNDRTFVESESLSEIPQMQTNDVTNDAFSHTESHTATRRRDLSTPRGAPTAPHVHFGSDLKLHHSSTQQIAVRIMNVTSDFPITTETNDFVSPAPAASASALIVSTDARESAATANESERVVVEKSTRAAQAERMVQSAGRIEPSSLRESPATATTDKLTPAVKRRNTTETQSGEQFEREISAQAIEQNQHAPPDTTTATHPINDPGPSGRKGLLKAAHGGGEAHDTTPTRVQRVGYSPKVLTLDGTAQHEEQTSHEKISVGQMILGTVTDSVPPTGISPAEISDKTSCRTIGCVESGERNEATTGAGGIDHSARERLYKTQAGITGGDHFDEVHAPDPKAENGNRSSDRPVPEKATPQATNLDYAALSPAAGKSDRDLATVEDTTRKNAKSVTGETSTRTRRGLVETDHSEGREEPEPPPFVEKTTQRHSHRQTSGAFAAEVTLPEPEASTVQSTVKTGERAQKQIKTQLNRGADKAAQKATRSARSVAKGETAESGRTLLLLEPGSEQRRRRSSPHLYLSGITEVSDDLCGSGNYTAEMSVTLGRGVDPGDAVPALADLRVDINLKTNSSGINLKVTSCCLSPSIRPDPTNSTCCLFSRLAAAPAGITPLPSGLSTGASFTISLFQMINYSAVYLHCELRVCPRNRSDCERRCLQQRNAFPSEGREAIVTDLRNRISFGPMLKEVKNSTFPEKMELDLVLVLVSLLAGSSLVTVTLLLVWLAYRRRAIWLLYSAAPPRACCGCLHPGGDLIPP